MANWESRHRSQLREGRNEGALAGAGWLPKAQPCALGRVHRCARALLFLVQACVRGIIENHFSPDLMASRKFYKLPQYFNYPAAQTITQHFHSIAGSEKATMLANFPTHFPLFSSLPTKCQAIRLYRSVYTRLHCYGCVRRLRAKE